MTSPTLKPRVAVSPADPVPVCPIPDESWQYGFDGVIVDVVGFMFVSVGSPGPVVIGPAGMPSSDVWGRDALLQAAATSARDTAKARLIQVVR
jgi:hypothetical protein